MKQIVFSETQKALLINVLGILIKYYDTCIAAKELEYVIEKKREYYVSALDKINKNDMCFYKNNEQLACVSCINEHYDKFRNEKNLPDFYSWLEISDEQKKVIQKLDDCEDILVKCGYYSKKNPIKKFRYYNILADIEKLRKSDKIFLQGSKGDFYKIVFVYDNKEYATFELRAKISVEEIEFKGVGKLSMEKYAKSNLMHITTKSGAIKMLNSCRYTNETLVLINKILSQWANIKLSN